MAEIVENKERVFEHFLELKPSLRMRMFDEMETNDRCRITRCSKLCNKEAKGSKYYIHTLKFDVQSKRLIQIEVKYQQFNFRGYHLWVFERSGKKVMMYMSLNRQVSWEVELDDSANVFQCAFEKFRKILQTFQNLLKVLHVTSFTGQTVGQTLDYGIESLNRLKHLCVWGEFDAVQLLSKIQHPLETLMLKGEDNEQLINCEQLYQVRDRLDLSTLQLKNENFLRLSVKNSVMRLGNMTEKDVFKFIRSWQDGTIGRETEYTTWFFDKKIFDKNKLFRLLRLRGEEENEFIELKHFKEHGKTARLYHSNNTMRFYDSKFMI